MIRLHPALERRELAKVYVRGTFVEAADVIEASHKGHDPVQIFHLTPEQVQACLDYFAQVKSLYGHLLAG